MVRCEFTLPVRQPLANARAVRHELGRTRHLGSADRVCDVLSIEQNLIRRQLDGQCLHECRQGGFIAEVDAVPDRRKCDGAIHRAGVEESPAQSLRQAPRDRALASRRRSVDGDDTLHRGLVA